MAQAKKFGTFAGVFTPSILTILGVIMYLRLPWIVGQAGLYMTIGIILVAHVISVTTGMSVSSIATDKRVKAGGTYYMISRSLGLPIGGTLGLALFVGLSFSVSLYLIGFSESLLGFFNMEITKNTIRIAGTIALVCVTTITLISTSLAIKTQFLIMAAILVSLGSIFLGNHEYSPTAPLLLPLKDSAPFIVLFGIFFPAVTGFESGVSMSGDLKDPKKSILLGTIIAIVVGLFVYLGLAFYFAFSVNSDQLTGNSKVLLDISLNPHLVVAGIWGATISSALGSILGAPRILQATSHDHITPGFFGVGYGKENEPRNALLLTFVIAEASILIGELDVIARVVSMFFITTYGFLNLSCAAESWASPDFRPEFKTPKTVSIIGSVTCFIVMVELDILAMIGATIILLSVFFYLKRKELTLETGDTWEGIWSSMIRSGLHRLNQRETHQRNWRPNIILFSGGTSARPHLIETGKWLVDKRGLLSNFDLNENPDLNVLFRKTDQSIRDDVDDGIFARRIECSDKFECMETISKYYGFSGIEPNTVLIGWGHNTEKPDKFLKVLTSVISLDLNLMLLNYVDGRGFGNHETIDVWWRGSGNNISLALALIRFLTASQTWQDVTIRFLTVTEESASVDRLFDEMNKLLLDYRLEGVVKIINNAAEKKPFAEILARESGKADLVVIGIPDIHIEAPANYINKVNTIIDPLGTALLIYASSFFEPVHMSDTVSYALSPKMVPEDTGKDAAIYTLAIPSAVNDVPSGLKPVVLKLFNKLQEIGQKVDQSCVAVILNHHQGLSNTIHDLMQGSFTTLEKKLSANEKQRNHRLILRVQSEFLFHVRKIFSDFTKETLAAIEKNLSVSIEKLYGELPGVASGFPKTVMVNCTIDALLSCKTETVKFSFYKRTKTVLSRFNNGNVRYHIHFREIIDNALKSNMAPSFRGLYTALAINNYLLIRDLNRFIDMFMDMLRNIENRQLTDPLFLSDMIRPEKEKIAEEFKKIESSFNSDFKNISDVFMSSPWVLVSALSDELKQPDIGFKKSTIFKGKVKWISFFEKELFPVPSAWSENMTHALNFTSLDLTLLSFQNRLRTIIERAKVNYKLIVQNHYREKLNGFQKCLQTYLEESQDASCDKLKIPYTFKETVDVRSTFESMKTEIHAAIIDLPESMDVLDYDQIGRISEKPFDPLETRILSLQQLIEYLIETELLSPLEDKTADIFGLMTHANTTGMEVVRLITLHQKEMEGLSGATESQSLDNFKSVLKMGVERIQDEHRVFETMDQNLSDDFTKFSNSVFERLNPSSIAKDVETLPHYFRKLQSAKVMTHFETVRASTLARVNELNIRFLYYRHKKHLEKIEIDNRPLQFDLFEKLLDFVESVSPDRSALNAIPFYYRHLFLGKPPVTKEFWLGRKKEIAQAEKTVLRYRNMYKGALMIVGESFSGKTALSQYIASKYFAGRNIYQINPPDEGSIDPFVFNIHLRDAFQDAGDVADNFSALENESVIIFNDCELWWERSTRGFAVIDRILGIIDQYSHRFFFILNANVCAYRYMSRINKKFKNYFLDILNCSPFDVETMKQVILLRHRSTGLKFSWLEKDEEMLTDLKMVRFFIFLSKRSGGNIGVALQNWIWCIEKVTRERIVIDIKPEPDIGIFRNMEPVHLVLLGQFHIHKRLSLMRLIRVTKMVPEELAHHIRTLKRCGLLVETVANIFEINSFVKPYLADYLEDRGIL